MVILYAFKILEAFVNKNLYAVRVGALGHKAGPLLLNTDSFVNEPLMIIINGNTQISANTVMKHIITAFRNLSLKFIVFIGGLLSENAAFALIFSSEHIGYQYQRKADQ